jgi:hypothetical protein
MMLHIYIIRSMMNEYTLTFHLFSTVNFSPSSFQPFLLPFFPPSPEVSILSAPLSFPLNKFRGIYFRAQFPKPDI